MRPGDGLMGHLEAALSYHALGLSIIPIAAGTKEPPRGMTWKRFQTTRPSESELRAWFGRDRYALAVVLGSVSGGLVCRDFDAMEAFDAWAADYPKLAQELPTVETGRPGRHVYCRADVDQVTQVSRSGGGIIDLGDGELRGSGGYCLLPPSRHPSGHNYRWLVPLRAPIPFLDLNSCGFLKNGHATESNREDRDNRGQLRTTEDN